MVLCLTSFPMLLCFSQFSIHAINNLAGLQGWLESELSSPVMDQLAVPVANTLLDLSASPVPPAAPFGTQVVVLTFC